MLPGRVGQIQPSAGSALLINTVGRGRVGMIESLRLLLWLMALVNRLPCA